MTTFGPEVGRKEPGPDEPLFPTAASGCIDPTLRTDPGLMSVKAGRRCSDLQTGFAVLGIHVVALIREAEEGRARRGIQVAYRKSLSATAYR